MAPVAATVPKQCRENSQRTVAKQLHSEISIGAAEQPRGCGRLAVERVAALTKWLLPELIMHRRLIAEHSPAKQRIWRAIVKRLGTP